MSSNVVTGELDEGARDVHLTAVGGTIGRERYKLPLGYTEDEGIRGERDARTHQPPKLPTPPTPLSASRLLTFHATPVPPRSSDDMEDRHLPTEPRRRIEEEVRLPEQSPWRIRRTTAAGRSHGRW